MTNETGHLEGFQTQNDEFRYILSNCINELGGETY